MFKTLLIPLDGSEAAESVFPYAVEIATKCGSGIVLVSVSDPALGDESNLYLPYLERAAERVKRQLVDWGGDKDTVVQVNTLTGRPAERILDYAQDNDVDLVLISSRGAHKGALAIGHIAWKVLEASHVPVLLVKAPASLEALEQKSVLKKILLPLDGSQVGGLMVPYIETLAQALFAEVVLFHILETHSVGVLAPGIEISYQALTRETEKNVHLKYLDDIEHRFGEKGINTSTVINMGPAIDEITRYAENNSVDLIAMSTHGRSGIGRWVFGSVTRRVLQSGKIPVMTMRAKGFPIV